MHRDGHYVEEHRSALITFKRASVALAGCQRYIMLRQLIKKKLQHMYYVAFETWNFLNPFKQQVFFSVSRLDTCPSSDPLVPENVG